MIRPNFGLGQWNPHWNQMSGSTTRFEMPHQQPSRYAPYPVATSGFKQESTGFKQKSTGFKQESTAGLYPLQSLIQSAHQPSPFSFLTAPTSRK